MCSAKQYNKSVIKTFKDRRTARLFEGRAVKFPSDVVERAEAKLKVLDRVSRVEELRLPPSSRLHRLGGGREGQWAISINRQWRICFEFDDEEGNAYAVEVADYH